MVQRIKEIGAVATKENPKNHAMEEIPLFILELHDRISENNPDKAMDLQFTGNTADWNDIFIKECSFGTMEEMEVGRRLLEKIKELDDSNDGKGTDFVLYNSPFTNTMGVFTDEDADLYTFPGLQSFQYMIEILKWITAQELLFK